MPAGMTAPISYPHSPFLYHHVPNSPFLMPTRPQATQSPVPLVPDIDNRHPRSGLLRNGRDTSTRLPYPVNQSLFSPTPVVPSISAPPTPQPATPSSANVSSTPQKEQVVPHFSPLVERHSTHRKERRLETSPSQATVPEINLFAGDEIFA
ncbi:hypothetical protein ACROYT_G040229 [Oculina patagonica]